MGAMSEITRTSGPTLAHSGPSERAISYAKAARTEGTWNAYTVDWQDWLLWAEGRGVQQFPAHPADVASYVAMLADAGAALSTIERRVASISVAHRTAGIDSPCRSEMVRRTMAGIRRTAPEVKQATAITLPDLRKILAVCDPTTVLGLRDRALILVGFAGAFRRSELVALDVGDIAVTDEGFTVKVRRSKTDQEGHGLTKALPYGHSGLCPPSALDAWLNEARIGRGPVFRSVSKSGKVSADRLSDRTVSRVVQRRALQAGLEGSWSGHSLRAGFVTTAAAKGASERSIAAQTGHAPNSSVLRSYIRHASVFTDNAATGLGL